MGTKRTIDDRLFERVELQGGWSLSIQADHAGYCCRPKTRLSSLEDYEEMEVAVYGPYRAAPEIRSMGLPDEVAAKFPKNRAIGEFLTWADVAALTECIAERHLEPGFGAPRGSAEWPHAYVFVELEDGEEAAVREGDHQAVMSRLLPGALLETDPKRLDPERKWARLALVSQPAVIDLRNAQDRAFYDGPSLPREVEARLEALSVWGVDAVFHPEDARLELVTPAVLEEWIWPVFPEHAPRGASHVNP